jgi:glucosamine-6-phosphate deaminase
MERAGASVKVFSDAGAACRAAADLIAKAIRTHVQSRGRVVLGLATGSSPIALYSQLVSMHRAGELSFAEVTSYNLDEYYPIHPTDPNSYHYYMHRHLFSRVDIAPNRAHLFDGTVPEPFAARHAADFDHWIEADGGLDLQLLGIGRNGHIGFNEPSDLLVEQVLTLGSRLVTLHSATRADAARDFGREANVIPHALTLGVAPILAARAIVMLALGPSKAAAVAAALDGPMTAALPASLLQAAPRRVTWFLDQAAAEALVWSR